jgi:hypothetical protein
MSASAGCGLELGGLFDWPDSNQPLGAQNVRGAARPKPYLAGGPIVRPKSNVAIANIHDAGRDPF